MKPDVQTFAVPQLSKDQPAAPVIGSSPGTKPGSKPQSAPSWVSSGKGTPTASGNMGGKQLTGQ